MLSGAGLGWAGLGWTALLGGLLILHVVNADASDFIDPLSTQNYQPNAYGLGVNSNSYGQPFQWQTQQGQPAPDIFQGNVKPDAYGLGVGQDQFGRPVRAKRWP